MVGLGLLVSETGHVPLLYRTYSGNGSDQGVLGACLKGLKDLHEALAQTEDRARPAQRTLVRDGGFWSPQLELDLDSAGYYSLISLPFGHNAAEEALQMAARRHEASLRQTQRARSAHPHCGRGLGPNARCGGKRRAAGGAETRHRGGPA